MRHILRLLLLLYFDSFKTNQQKQNKNERDVMKTADVYTRVVVLRYDRIMNE